MNIKAKLDAEVAKRYNDSNIAPICMQREILC